MEEERRHDRFDVDNDFEGGRWIGGDFFATGKRKKRQQARRGGGVLRGPGDPAAG
jgi:tuftelin-interacting protein 11